jgi:transposase
MPKRYELSNEQWRRIEDLLAGKNGDRGRTAADNRLFVNAVLWVLRSGARWSDLPERYGKWKSVHKRFTRWAKKGVWERIFNSLTGDPDNQYLMLDTTLVRAHQQAATGKGGAKIRLWGVRLGYRRERGTPLRRRYRLLSGPGCISVPELSFCPTSTFVHFGTIPFARGCSCRGVGVAPLPCSPRQCPGRYRVLRSPAVPPHAGLLLFGAFAT